MNRPRLLTRHRLVPLALLGALTLGPACKGKDDPAKQDNPKSTDSTNDPAGKAAPNPAGASGLVENPTDSPAVAELGEVVATVQLPSGFKLSDIAAVLDGIQPGASAMLGLQLPTLLEQAAGFDLAKSAKLDAPLSFVIVNPTSHPQPLAILIEAKDAAKLGADAQAAGHAVEQRGDLLLIGPADVVAAAKDFAFTNLVKYPDHSEIVVYPQPLLAAFSGQIEQGLANMGGAMAALGTGNDGLTGMMRGYVEGLIAIGNQTQRVVLSVGGKTGSADLIARFYPVDGTVFASFVAAQKPSDHALLAKLPAGDAMMLASGNLEAGAARDAFLDFAIKVITPMYGSGSPDEWMAMFKPWLDNLDGSFAMAMNMTLPGGAAPAGMQMRTLMGINDAATMRTAWREMLVKMTSGPAIELMGMKIVAKHQADVFEHDGVGVDLYSSTIDASGLPPDQAAAIQAAGTGNQSMHLTAFDKLAAMASADEDGQAMRSLIDAARGKGSTLEVAGQFATVLDGARQRGDSMVMYFDIGTMMASAPTPPPTMPFRAMSWAVGQQQGALSVRVSVIK
ncbi:MAG TPA: hypothetical protein VK034_09470 [Enhygromyxa sp.]|nr:hypothetical protein [Enhygromyxa sp.]